MGRHNRSAGAARACAMAAVGILLSATACGSDGEGASAGPVTIRFDWWGNPDRATVTEKAIDEFERKNPDIKVETSYAEFNAYFQKLATQIAGGNAPDVLQMDYRYVREYADRNVLADLNDGAAKVDSSGVTKQLLSGGTVGGKLYGIPPTQNTQMFSYDFAQWEQSGATAPKDGWKWNDLKASAQKVTDATGGKVRGIADFGGIEDWFEVWLRQQGKSLYTDDGKLGYGAAEVQQWWEMVNEWRRSGASTPAELTTKIDGAVANDPVAQKLASGGFGYDSGFTAQTWEIFGRELKVAPFPSDTGKLGQYAKPAMMFCVAQRSENKAAAAKLINFLIGDQDAGKILGMSRGLPANQQVRDQVGATLQGPPVVTFDYEKLIGPKLEQAPPPPPKGAGEAKAAFQRVYDDVIFERGSIRENAEKFVNQAMQAISS